MDQDINILKKNLIKTITKLTDKECADILKILKTEEQVECKIRTSLLL